MLSPETAFFIGNFGVKFYSIAMFFAIFFGTLLSCLIAKKYYKDVKIEHILDMLPIVIISAIIGARIYYVTLDWNYYSKSIFEIFALWHGGISIHGALIGGFLGGLYYIKKHKLNLWKYADVFAYGLLLGQSIGRIGNFFNIEAFGKPCNFSDVICLYIPINKRPTEFLNFDYFHPTFLYESLWNIFVLLILFFVIRKNKTPDGAIFFSYLILYSLGRLFIEQIRLDSVLNIGTIPIAQIVCILTIIISTAMLLILKKSLKAQ